MASSSLEPMNGRCPPKYHLRHGYTSKKGRYVHPRCVRSTTIYTQSSANFNKSQTAKTERRLKNMGKSSSSTKKCPPGQILRKGYVRRFQTATRSQGYSVKRGNTTYRAYPSKTSTYVKPSCIKDRGLPGSKNVFGHLRKGDLSKYGYNVKKTEKDRHEALNKAIEEYGALGTFRKLNAVAKLSIRTAPSASKIFEEDRDWVRKTHSLKAF
jgi:hypothetical protein